MELNIVDLIKLGALSQKEFGLNEGFTIQLFPPDIGPYVIVAKPEIVTSKGKKQKNILLDKVQMKAVFLGFQQEVAIQAGYSRTHNILCLSQKKE